MSRPRIVVVGAGIYGVTIAARLSPKYDVDLVEELPDILLAASGVNQFRLHRGYHYPRSAKTIASSLESEKLFRNEYEGAILKNIKHFYCIAKEGSFISAEKYLQVCDENNLEYKVVKPPKYLNASQIDVCIQVQEGTIDPHALYELAWERLKRQGVNVLLNTRATPAMLKKYDAVVICTYANLNQLVPQSSGVRQEYQYELCEKIVLSFDHNIYDRQSVVIMDGPFTCLDPYGSTGNFLMGNVVHALHHTNVGSKPVIPQRYHYFMNAGLIKNPNETNFEKFIESASVFFSGMHDAQHVGSLYTVRAVLPNKEKTDERPMIVKKVAHNIISTFAGKLSNCMEASLEAEKFLTHLF